MVGENFAGNIIVNLASLPDFLRSPILKKRMVEFFSLSEPERKEVINNALEAGPTIPFSSNSFRRTKKWIIYSIHHRSIPISTKINCF